ncbi:MAG: hypothetical protein QOE77_1905 [Blastocatellia bacterium]|nr:hypothetical protein [Blastocatellia bacterium]
MLGALVEFPVVGEHQNLLRALAANFQVSSQVPANAANRQADPQVQNIRKIVASINAGLKRHAFKVSQRKFEYCEPYEDTLRRIAIDDKGIARSYVKEGGSDDSALKWEHYYDSAGRLRFVFITGGAVNGSELEHRIYFDEAGKRIREEQKYVKGPGYTFPEKWPDEQLQSTEARKAFAAKSPCSEIRPHRRYSRRG